MTRQDKRIGFYSKQPRRLVIEAPGVMVTVHVGLYDEGGHAVTRVDVTADGDRYTGDDIWWADCGVPSRAGIAVRVVRQ